MKFSDSAIGSASRTTGFRPEVLEKALHLIHLLNALTSHPGLSSLWCNPSGVRPAMHPG